jgi:hypothetical protein
VTDQSWKSWVAAGIKLGSDPSAIVPCPVCGNDHLSVVDAPQPAPGKIDRYLFCQACGAKNVLTGVQISN